MKRARVVELYRADFEAYAVSLADVPIYRYVCARDGEALRGVDGPPDVDAVDLFDYLSFLAEIWVYGHQFATLHVLRRASLKRSQITHKTSVREDEAHSRVPELCEILHHLRYVETI